MLSDSKDYYFATDIVQIPYPSKYKNEFSFLKEIDSMALIQEELNLIQAFKNYFKNPSHFGFPKFKSKKNVKQSFTTQQYATIRIEDGKLRMPKVKDLIKIKLHRQIPENHKIKCATISKTSTGKYFVSILTEFEFDLPAPILDTENSLGLDYSQTRFFVDNQNRNPKFEKFFKKSENRLVKEQRRLSHMTFGSSNYLKQKLKVAKMYEKIANQRKDFLHNLSTKLANQYDMIFVEDLNLRNMSKALKLGKNLMDNSFGMFREMLTYKMFVRGKIFEKIPWNYPSSKLCHHCGTVNQNLSLGEMNWTCECGTTINRDENAAQNIRSQGILQIKNRCNNGDRLLNLAATAALKSKPRPLQVVGG